VQAHRVRLDNLRDQVTRIWRLITGLERKIIADEFGVLQKIFFTLPPTNQPQVAVAPAFTEDFWKKAKPALRHGPDHVSPIALEFFDCRKARCNVEDIQAKAPGMRLWSIADRK
jgi:hypothetical protein